MFRDCPVTFKKVYVLGRTEHSSPPVPPPQCVTCGYFIYKRGSCAAGMFMTSYEATQETCWKRQEQNLTLLILIFAAQECSALKDNFDDC